MTTYKVKKTIEMSIVVEATTQEEAIDKVSNLSATYWTIPGTIAYSAKEIKDGGLKYEETS